MKKHNWKDVVLGMALMALVMGLAIPALAATVKTIEANYMDIKLVVDGEAIVPKDVNGNVVEPFAVDGTTYLPVRAISQALEKEVTWDGNTNTVYIGEVPAGAIVTLPESEVQWTDVDIRRLDTVWKRGMAANIAYLPHTAKVLKETGAMKNSDGWDLVIDPQDISTGSIGVGKGYERNELWITSLDTVIGMNPDVQDQDYLKILKAILLDIVPDESDAVAIGEMFDEVEKYQCALNAAKTEAEQDVAIEMLHALKNNNLVDGEWTNLPIEYNSVVLQWHKDWKGLYVSITKK